MTRPGSGSPDQSANEDDAVWLDLVARLEGTASEDGSNSNTPGRGPSRAVPDTPVRPATFRDFDPLGLAGRPPTELSAAERSAAARTGNAGQSRSGEHAGAGQDSQPAPDGQENLDGPRDYAVEEDGGDFVPEDPPSLSGTDPLTMLAWLGAVGGPLSLLLSAMFWRSAPLLAIVGMVVAFILAVVYLIMKLPQEKDDNDDGARV